MTALLRRHRNFLLAAALSFAFALPAYAVQAPASSKQADQSVGPKVKVQPAKNNNQDAVDSLSPRKPSRKAAKLNGDDDTQDAQQGPRQPQPAKEKTQRGPSVDYSRIESIGLYDSEREGSVGANVWGKTRHSTLASLIQKIAPEQTSPTLQALNQQLLLTAGSVRNVSKDGDIAPGEDLFTLRMEKLIEMGAYGDAANMYALNKNDPYTARLAHTGILATLYTGEKSLACLNTRASTQDLEKDDFINDFLAYCTVTLEDKPDDVSVARLKNSKYPLLNTLANSKTYRFSYAPKSFGSLSMLEQAVLVAEGRLDLNNVAAIDRNSIPARDLPLLLEQKNLDKKQKFILTLQSVRRGMLSNEAVFNMYEDMLKPGLGQDPKAGPQKPNTDWEMIPYLYSVAGDMVPGPEQTGIVKQAFNLAGIYGDEALIPFSPYIAGLKPTDLSLKDMRRAFVATEAAGGSLPQAWTAALEDMEPKEEAAKKQYYQLYMANYIAETPTKRTPEQLKRIMTYLDGQKSLFSHSAKIIIENLDNKTKDNDNAAGIYEKDFGLTSAGDYVMPSVDVWDRLYRASQNKNLGETILLSALALQGNSLQEIYPGVLREVLNGFDNVGLNDVSRSLAIEAVLGN